MEAGFEMNLLKQRLRLSPVYYNKTTKDLLTSVPGISGSTPDWKISGNPKQRMGTDRFLE
ncbi:hypothetical protein BFINE_04940 [Bacteroides finegoldii DSM 17565]|nr:hypothetical protein BFINE_04940 [Bacteroides finegoldii DSM 17565]